MKATWCLPNGWGVLATGILYALVLFFFFSSTTAGKAHTEIYKDICVHVLYGHSPKRQKKEKTLRSHFAHDIFS